MFVHMLICSMLLVVIHGMTVTKTQNNSFVAFYCNHSTNARVYVDTKLYDTYPLSSTATHHLLRYTVKLTPNRRRVLFQCVNIEKHAQSELAYLNVAQKTTKARIQQRDLLTFVNHVFDAQFTKTNNFTIMHLDIVFNAVLSYVQFALHESTMQRQCPRIFKQYGTFFKNALNNSKDAHIRNWTPYFQTVFIKLNYTCPTSDNMIIENARNYYMDVIAQIFQPRRVTTPAIIYRHRRPTPTRPTQPTTTLSSTALPAVKKGRIPPALLAALAASRGNKPINSNKANTTELSYQHQLLIARTLGNNSYAAFLAKVQPISSV